jgi:hypothetical protein
MEETQLPFLRDKMQWLQPESGLGQKQGKMHGQNYEKHGFYYDEAMRLRSGKTNDYRKTTCR